MKIAILTCGMLPIPAVQGGAVENMIDFYLEYNNRKKLHDITIFSPWDKKVTQNSALASDVNHYLYIDVTSLKARIARKIYGSLHANEYYNYFIEYYFEKVYTKLREQDYDVIVLENSPGHTYKLSQRGHKNIVLHLNNDLLNAKSRFHEEIFNGLSKILTCSDYIRDRVSTIAPDRKVQTLYNAIDVKNFTPKQTNDRSTKRTDLGFATEDFVIVYSGRVNKDKGVSELIDAILLLKDELPVKLMIIGGTFYGNAGNEDDFVCTLKDKAKDIQDRIVFTGFVPYVKIPDYLQLADIAVLPSMWEEPFGLTIVEALAAGLPLITTRSGGIPEICKGVATIVEKDNIVKNLTTAIMELYKSSKKREIMSSLGLERAKDFDKVIFAQNFFAALEGL